MSTESQIAANRANAQHLSGPKTAPGQAASSCNNFRHGFTAFQQLLHGLEAEYNPFTFTEHLLVAKKWRNTTGLGNAPCSHQNRCKIGTNVR